MSRRPADALAEERRAGRSLEETAVGSPHLQRWTDLTARLLAADGVKVALLGEVATVAGGAGLSRGSLGEHLPLDGSLSGITLTTAPDPLVVPDAASDPRLAAVPAVARGEVGAVLGTVLTGPDGEVLGALSAFTRAPRHWTEAEVAVLR